MRKFLTEARGKIIHPYLMFDLVMMSHQLSYSHTFDMILKHPGNIANQIIKSGKTCQILIQEKKNEMKENSLRHQFTLRYNIIKNKI
jgi:hypothetical protein